MYEPPPGTPPKPWLTVPEAAFYVHRSPQHIYRLIRENKLTTTETTDGTTVNTASLLTHFANTRRGRPRHTQAAA